MATGTRSWPSRIGRRLPAGMLVALFGVALTGAAWLQALQRIRADREAEVRRIDVENGDLARAFEEHVRHSLQATDNALRFLQSQHESGGLVSASLADYLEHVGKDRLVNQILITDESGKVLLASAPRDAPPNVSGAEHFSVHAASPSVGLYIGKPTLDPASQTQSFFLSRRLERPDGSFAGVVAAGLSPEYFSSFYDTFEPGPGRAVLLVGRDGIVRARRGRQGASSGEDLRDGQILGAAAGSAEGHYASRSPLDGRQRMVSFRALADYPLIVVVADLTEQALAPFERRRRTQLLLALVFTLGVGAFCSLLIRTERSARGHNLRLTQELAERQRVEHALRESQELFSAFLENIPAAVIVQDLKGHVLFANQTYQNLPGREAIGRNARELLAPAEEGVADSLPELRGRFVVLDETLTDQQGRTRVFETRMFVVDREGQEPLLGCISVDCTARRQAEEERLTFERRMQQTQKLESLGVLAGGIAHDFNNLLMVILGNADLALSHADERSAAVPFVRNIETAAQRAADLANQMLAYSGKGRFVIERVDLSHLVEEMAHLLASAISKRAEFRYRLAPKLPPVEADPTQIRQVVMNLITNASDALEGGKGTITVATSVVEIPPRPFGAGAPTPGTYAAIEISDTGRGIEPALRGRIFDPFYTTKQPGRGLGLAAVLGIVRGHGGEVQVESATGRGTTFRILLPVSSRPAAGGARGSELGSTPAPVPEAATAATSAAEPATESPRPPESPVEPAPALAAAATPAAVEAGGGSPSCPIGADDQAMPPAAPAPGPPESRQCVLVVDDEPHVLSTARDMLEQYGYEVAVAADGEEGVAVFRERCGRLSAVLLDMNMPRVDGAEAFRQMRAIDARVPIVMTSGYDEQDAVGQLTGQGLAGFLQKPYRIATLLQKISEAIGSATRR